MPQDDDPFDPLDNPTPSLDKVQNDIAFLRESHDILTEVWRSVGPYADRGIDPKVLHRMREHFRFDDSE